MMSFIAVAATILFASVLAVSSVPSPAWAQISPSTLTPDPSPNPQSSVLPKILPEFSGIEFVADPVQNNTSSNITQLATILPNNNEPITPSTSLVPVDEVADQNTASSSNDDDDDDNGDDSSNNYSGDDDSGDDDSGDDDSGDDDSGDDDGDGDGGGGGAFASAGGAFASAG